MGGRGAYLEELYGSLHLFGSVKLLVHRLPRRLASRGHHFSAT